MFGLFGGGMLWTLFREICTSPTALPVTTVLFRPFLFLIGFVALQAIPLPGLLAGRVLIPRNDFLSARIPDLPLGTGAPGAVETVSFIPSVTWTVFFFFVVAFVLFLCAFNSIRTIRDLRVFSVCFVSGVFVLCFLSFVNLGLEGKGIFFLYPDEFTPRKFGPIPNHEHYAGLLTLVLPLAVHLVVTARKREFKGLFVFFTIIILSALIFTTSRAAMVGVFLAGLVTLGIGRWGYGLRLKFRHFLLPVVFLVGSLFFVNVGKFLSDVHSLFTPWDEMTFRFKLWRDFPRMFASFPFFGSGLGTYPWIYPVFRTLGGSRTVFSPENIYLLVLMEMGLVGFSLCLWFLFSLLYRTFARLRVRRNAEVMSFVLSGVAGIIGTAIYSLADFGLEVPAVGFGLVVIGAMIYRATLVTEDDPLPQNNGSRCIKKFPRWVGYPGKVLLLGGWLLLVVGPLSQEVVSGLFWDRLERDYFHPRSQRVTVSDKMFSRIDRIYRLINCMGPKDISQAQGEFYFVLTRKKGWRSPAGDLHNKALLRAGESFERCLHHNPFNTSCRSKLGWIAWEENDLDRAERLLAGVTRINQNDPDGFYNLATFYYYSGSFEKAREQFLKLHRFSPGYRKNIVAEKLRLLDLLAP